MKNTSSKSKSIQIEELVRAIVQNLYDQQAKTFPKNYNRDHPDHPIWRHICYKRTITVLYNSEDVTITVRVVRFIHAHTNKTFTFYGTLLLPRTHYSLHLLREWIGTRPAKLSRNVEKRWISFVNASKSSNKTAESKTPLNN